VTIKHLYIFPKSALKVLEIKTGKEFKIGTGFDDTTREFIWKNKESYIGKIVKYKTQLHGSKDKPRFPVFLGFRHEEDF